MCVEIYCNLFIKNTKGIFVAIPLLSNLNVSITRIGTGNHKLSILY